MIKQSLHRLCLPIPLQKGKWFLSGITTRYGIAVRRQKSLGRRAILHFYVCKYVCMLEMGHSLQKMAVNGSKSAEVSRADRTVGQRCIQVRKRRLDLGLINGMYNEPNNRRNEMQI